MKKKNEGFSWGGGGLFPVLLFFISYQAFALGRPCLVVLVQVFFKKKHLFFIPLSRPSKKKETHSLFGVFFLRDVPAFILSTIFIAGPLCWFSIFVHVNMAVLLEVILRV